MEVDAGRVAGVPSVFGRFVVGFMVAVIEVRYCCPGAGVLLHTWPMGAFPSSAVVVTVGTCTVKVARDNNTVLKLAILRLALDAALFRG